MTTAHLRVDLELVRGRVARAELERKVRQGARAVFACLPPKATETRLSIVLSSAGLRTVDATAADAGARTCLMEVASRWHLPLPSRGDLAVLAVAMKFERTTAVLAPFEPPR